MGAGHWRPGGLLGSPFNVKWRCSALAGDVEGSKLCLFSVIMPAKCVSSVFPRFHYRRVAFCFLPLAAILESEFMFFACGLARGALVGIFFFIALASRRISREPILDTLWKMP
jgi:hypothetical protein